MLLTGDAVAVGPLPPYVPQRASAYGSTVLAGPQSLLPAQPDLSPLWSWLSKYRSRVAMHSASAAGIEWSGWDILSQQILDQAVRRVVQMYAGQLGLPEFVASVIKQFQTITEVKRVIPRLIEQERRAVLSIFVWMPAYDYRLMDRLIDVEMNSDVSARKYGYRLEYAYLPLPYVDPSTAAAPASSSEDSSWL